MAFALVKAPDWGWGSAAFLGTMAAAIACGTAMVARSRAHHSPVIELGLLRSRAFTGAFTASILYYGAFGAFVLNTVEFLTGVWHYSAIRAGLAIGPGPLMVLPFASYRRAQARRQDRRSRPGRRHRLRGQRGRDPALARPAPGHPAYLTHLLPAQLLGGAGVGLSIPSLLGAGSAALPPARFGTGSGVLNMARQIGTVIGVAALVAILAKIGPRDPVPTFRHALILIASLFAGAGLVAAALLTQRKQPSAAH